MAEDSVAQDQIKAFVDRILRLKEESKALAQDIREIYAEAKGNGFDKTVLGKLVNYVEKRQSDAAAIMESEALFELYLTAYDGRVGRSGTDRATHTHASEDRGVRSKARLSEAMDDNKALSAEMLADGLISAEANDENIALSDAVAEKLGAGVISITEPQPTKAAGSDLTIPQSLSGQVADILETGILVSNEAPMAVDGDSVEDAPAPLSESVDIVPGGEVVETLDGADQPPAASISDAGKSVEADASAAPRPMYAEPGIITWEYAPPEGVERHEYCAAFGTLGQDIEVITEDLLAARAAPIVKVGKVIIDGWARYMKARELGIEYAVVQYDGQDKLIDLIRWNVAGRILSDEQKRNIAIRLGKIYPQRRGVIMAAFEGELDLVE